MTGLGAPALLLAWLVAAAASASSAYGARTSRADLVRWGERGLAAVFALTTAALVALVAALVRGDWSLVYVADHSSRATSWPYRVAGLWGGMSGSLLFWVWLLTGWALLAARRWRGSRRIGELQGGAQAALAATAAVFLGLLVTVSRPFATLAIPAIDGGGLTPVLRHPAMLYHPPLLYAGATALAVPFAVALTALVRRCPAAVWLGTARRWMLGGLALLTAGMVAGSHWAYVELGWGGYWAWDPVENGVLLPWLAGVAFLHSAVAARRRGGAAGPAASAAGLAGLTFALGLLGAFLTRSGVTDSVHAFAEGRTVGQVLLVALGAVGAALPALAVRHRPPPGRPPATRQRALVVNNVVLLGLAAAIGFGTLFPLLSEWATGDRLVVTGRYFAVVAAPLALVLLAGLGVGPRLPAGAAALRPALVGLVALGAAALLFDARRPVALAMAGLAGSAAALTVAEWRRRAGAGWRVRGGLLAHLGVALLLAGVAGTTSGASRTASLNPGQEVTVRGYTVRLVGVEPVPAPDRLRAARATVSVRRDGRLLTTLRPEALVSDAGDRVSVTALRSTPFEDLQVTLRAVAGGGRTVVVEIFVTPLAVWVWAGGLLVAAGLGLSLASPDRAWGRCQNAIWPSSAPMPCSTPPSPKRYGRSSGTSSAGNTSTTVTGG